MSKLIRLSYELKIKNVISNLLNRDIENLQVEIPIQIMVKRGMADNQKVSIENIVDLHDGESLESEKVVWLIIKQIEEALDVKIEREFIEKEINLNEISIIEIHKMVCYKKGIEHRTDKKFIMAVPKHNNEELKKIENSCDEFIRNKFEELDERIKSVDIATDPQTIFYIVTITEEHELKNYTNAAGIKIKFVDLTKEAIHRFHNTEDATIQLAFKNEDFVTMLDEYISFNSSSDEVLDKISKYGIESLTETDKSFLQG